MNELRRIYLMLPIGLMLPIWAVCTVTTACHGKRQPATGATGSAAAGGGAAKPFPQFPMAYRGSGRFIEIGNSKNQLVAFYEFDMNIGVNREHAYYINRAIEIFNVYDLRGNEPDREYFLATEPDSEQRVCTLQSWPLPKVFGRDWWMSGNMVYQGVDVVNGFDAYCWEGHNTTLDIPLRFCNRADAYPGFAPVLKRLGKFEFYDYHGQAVAPDSFPAGHFTLPPECAAL